MYEDEDVEDLYHNEVKEYSKGWTLPKHKRWRRKRNRLVTNHLNNFAPTERECNDCEGYMATLSLEDIRNIAAIRNEDLDLSDEALPDELIRVCINTLSSSKMTPEEEALGYFTRRKLKKLSTWNEWEAGEHKQINQFMKQQMFGPPVPLHLIPEDGIVMRPHWQYKMKRDGTRRSRMCCNGSKEAVPHLHAVASTWSSCVELPVQRMFLGICAALELNIYGSDIIDTYAHS